MSEVLLLTILTPLTKVGTNIQAPTSLVYTCHRESLIVYVQFFMYTISLFQPIRTGDNELRAGGCVRGLRGVRRVRKLRLPRGVTGGCALHPCARAAATRLRGQTARLLQKTGD